MIRFNAVKQLITPAVAGSALALALLVGVTQATPAGAAPLDPAGPSKIEIGALSVWPGSLEIGT